MLPTPHSLYIETYFSVLNFQFINSEKRFQISWVDHIPMHAYNSVGLLFKKHNYLNVYVIKWSMLRLDWKLHEYWNCVHFSLNSIPGVWHNPAQSKHSKVLVTLSGCQDKIGICLVSPWVMCWGVKHWFIASCFSSAQVWNEFEKQIQKPGR